MKMKEEFLLRGDRVMVSVPVREDNGIILDEASKREMMVEDVKQKMRLEVYAVGDGCDVIKEGDLVYVDIQVLMHRSCLVIVDGVEKYIVRGEDVLIIWK